MLWFKRMANAATVQSVITTSPKGNKFFNVIGNTFPIKDELKRLGFRYFKGTWSIFIDKAKSIRPQLEALGVDTSPLDMAPEPAPAPEVAKEPSTITPPAQAQPDKLTQTLAQMKQAIETALKSGKASGKTKDIFELVDRELDNLAGMVDESAKEEVVKSFLEFSSKFWKYSIGNQILIWAQKPDATYVSGYKAWLEKGRQVTNWDESISIMAPREFKPKLTDSYKQKVGWENMTPEQQTAAMSPRMYFAPVKVYDISATEPIPGWKNKEGKGPFEVPTLKLDNNEKLEHVQSLVEAGLRFANEVNIKVDLEKDLPEDYGGYSKGGDVVVNKLYQGLNQFGTLLHELAHEILHREDDQVTPVREERQVKEIDAETVSYIVMKHYGYETKTAPQYLALWRATGESMKNRRNHVAKAVKIIIDSINKQMGQIEAEEPLETTALTAHWLLSTCSFSK